jgi:large subunit ribosomal protein L24
MKLKLKLKKGDTVKVIAGNEKGKTGLITKMFAEKNRAIVEGLNIVSKHQKPSATNPNGGIDKVEAPIHVSNLALVDPKSGDATRVGRKVDESGKVVRFAKKTGELI